PRTPIRRSSSPFRPATIAASSAWPVSWRMRRLLAWFLVAHAMPSRGDSLTACCISSYGSTTFGGGDADRSSWLTRLPIVLIGGNMRRSLLPLGDLRLQAFVQGAFALHQLPHFPQGQMQVGERQARLRGIKALHQGVDAFTQAHLDAGRPQ